MRDRLLQIEPAAGLYATYSYRPDNLRATVHVNEGLLKQVWDLPGFTGYGARFQELEEDGDFKRAYYRAQRLVTQEEPKQSLVFMQNDLGSTRVLTDASQATQLSVQYNAWGKQVATSGSATPPLIKLNVSLDEEVVQTLKHRAAEEGKSMSRYLADLIREDALRRRDASAAEGYTLLSADTADFATAAWPLAIET